MNSIQNNRKVPAWFLQCSDVVNGVMHRNIISIVFNSTLWLNNEYVLCYKYETDTLLRHVKSDNFSNWNKTVSLNKRKVFYLDYDTVITIFVCDMNSNMWHHINNIYIFMYVSTVLINNSKGLQLRLWLYIFVLFAFQMNPYIYQHS